MWQRSGPPPRRGARSRHVSLITATMLVMVFPFSPPLIFQGLIKLRIFLPRCSEKCQKLIMRVVPHPHYNYTKMKHCEALEDHQLTPGLPASPPGLFCQGGLPFRPQGGILIKSLLINGGKSDFQISESKRTGGLFLFSSRLKLSRKKARSES